MASKYGFQQPGEQSKFGFGTVGRSGGYIVTSSSKKAAAPAAPATPAGLSPSARALWEKALAHYKPGGGFGAGVEAGLERGRVKSTASGMQNLVSAGLAGTTMAAGLGKKYEEEVAAPTRARVESARAEAISGLQAGMAGAEQRGYETAADRAFQMQMQQRDIAA